MIIQNRFSFWLLNIISRIAGGRYAAITLFPFIFISEDISEYNELVSHERIHIMQQLECLIVVFYAIYLYDYLHGRWYLGLSHDDAYRNIRFEKEAYANEYNLNYWKKRYLYTWLF